MCNEPSGILVVSEAPGGYQEHWEEDDQEEGKMEVYEGEFHGRMGEITFDVKFEQKVGGGYRLYGILPGGPCGACPSCQSASKSNNSNYLRLW